MVGVSIAATRCAEAYYAYGSARQLSPATQALDGHPILGALIHVALLIGALVLGAVVVAALVKSPHDM
jgi:hypothetical protein